MAVAKMQVLCFNYEHSRENSENPHNISLAIGVLGRSDPIAGLVEGSPAIALDIKDDIIFASAYVVLRQSENHDYWGEGSSETMPVQVVAYALTERNLIGRITDRWYPKTAAGKPKDVNSMLKDHSELMVTLWQKLTNQEFTPTHFLTLISD